MRYLLLDIGAGTLDILYYDDRKKLALKAVVQSPVQVMAERVAALDEGILIVGCQMGGGSLTQILREKAKTIDIVISRSAAETLHHDPVRVRAMGIRVVDDEKTADLRPPARSLIFGDLEMDRIERIVSGFGVPFCFDVVGICAQDHGVPSSSMSRLNFRHRLFTQIFDAAPFAHATLYASRSVPETLSRLTTLARRAALFPAEEVFVMDSAMAAVLGASMDYRANLKNPIIVIDAATSHTVAAAIEDGEIAGFFEYHTRDLTLERLESLIINLAEGNLSHDQILKEGGHGAYLRRTVTFDRLQRIIATGPKRGFLARSKLPIVFGAPFGDNMMTGAVGLLEAIRRHKGLAPMEYL